MSHPANHILILALFTFGSTLGLYQGCATHQTSPSASETIAYPEARRGDTVDHYFGTDVPDPYRWLEDPDGEESRQWIEEQNALTQSLLSTVKERDWIHSRLTTLWNYERYGIPFKKAGKYYYSHNNGLQNQSVLWATTDLNEKGDVVLDPNLFSEDGTTSLSSFDITEDGKHIAYGISEGGSDWNIIRVRNVETGKDLEDEIKWVKFSSPSWSKDGKGFYYSRFPEPTENAEQANYNMKVFYHILGTLQIEDTLIYGREDEPEYGFYAWVTDDGNYLVIHVSQGTEEKSRIYYRDLSQANSDVVRLLDDFDADYSLFGNDGNRFFFRTDLDATKYRVIAIDLDRPEREHWAELVPESEDTLRGVSLVGGKIVGSYMKDASTDVRTFSLDGTPGDTVALPGIGSAGGFGGKLNESETFFSFTSFTYPTTIFRLDLDSGEQSIVKQPQVDFDPADYEVHQEFFASKDGTQIPVFLIHKSGMEKNGAQPTFLYGYGGFNIPILPRFSLGNLVWLEMGGLLAIANLRGGGEYGREWHKAGTKLTKQNVFDDFIGAAEWLIEDGYTEPKRLAIHGRSNGGLLVGATMVQRPELFGAALPGVGVLDMLRYHKFTIGWAWASDYGTSEDNKEMFEALHAYSPYHNTKPGTAYPPTLVTTADHDDRVVPAHSFKFTAALQHAHAGPNPILTRIDTKAGHGAGKSIEMKIDELADTWAFVVRSLDMQVALPQSED